MQPPKCQSPVVRAQHGSLPQELLINIKLLERVPHPPFKQAEALVCSVQYRDLMDLESSSHTTTTTMSENT